MPAKEEEVSFGIDMMRTQVTDARHEPTSCRVTVLRGSKEELLMNRLTRILSLVLVSVVPLCIGTVFTGAPISAGPGTPGADTKTERVSAYYAAMAAEERELDQLADQHDDRYAALRAAHQAEVGAFLEKAHELGAMFGGEGEILDPVPKELLPLLQRVNKLTARLERSKGYQWRVAEQARRALESTKNPGTYATSVTYTDYTICIYRDPSAGTSSQSELTNLVNAAIGKIKSAVEWHSGGTRSIRWTTEWHGSYDLSGCFPSAPGGSGTTRYIYFRRNEQQHQGVGWCGNYAIVDLFPTGACVWNWNWPDAAATTHELGHVFGANHGSYATCGEYNDKDCGTSGCGKQSCDSSVYCVEEYADAGWGRTTSFCWADASQLCSHSESGYCGPAE